MTRARWVVIGAWAACAFSIGCSNSDGGTSANDQGVGGFVSASGGSVGQGGIVGASGFGGTSGAGGTTPGSGGMTAMPVQCGSNLCQPGQPLVPGFPGAAACCVDATMGTCGTVGLTGACAAPIPSDPRCSSPIPGLSSCCINNDCGIDGTMFGMPGCVDTSMFASNPMFSMFGGLLMAKHCDGTPIMTITGDAGGMGGAGGTATGGASGMSDAGPAGSGGTMQDSGTSPEAGH